MNTKCLGVTKNVTFRFNTFINEDLDKRKSHNGSKGEIIDKNFIKNISDTDSESTADSNKPSYLEKYENCTKILTNLETQCI
jgi:hypothetical protein